MPSYPTQFDPEYRYNKVVKNMHVSQNSESDIETQLTFRKSFWQSFENQKDLSFGV